jgi:hypothetical protein
MQCRGCSKAIDGDALEGPEGHRYCAGCFIELARAPRRLTSEERERLKRAVKSEMAGVLPREALERILEEGYGDLLKGDDFDETIRRTINQIEQTAGLAMCEEVLGVLHALQATIAEQEKEIREKVRRLTGL